MSAPAILNKAAFAFVGLLMVKLIVDSLFARISFRGHLTSIYVKYLSVFLFLTLFSAFLNQESIVLGIYEMRFLVIGFVLYLGIYNYFNSLLSITSFAKLFIWLSIIQVPFAVIQFVLAGGGKFRTLDSVTGTFGGYGELVACQVTALGILLTEKFVYRKNIIQLNSFIVAILILFPLLLSKSRSATLYVVLIIIFSMVYSMTKSKNAKSLLIGPMQVALFSGLASFLFYFMFWADNYDLSQQFSIDYVFSYYMREAVTSYSLYYQGADTNMGRAMAVYTAASNIATSFGTFFMGFGGGAASDASAIGLKGSLYQEYGILAGLGRNQYSKIIAELGLLGFLNIVLFFTVSAKYVSMKFSKTDRTRVYYTLILFSLVLMSFYSRTIGSFFYSFLIAFLFASLQKEIDLSKNNNK